VVVERVGGEVMKPTDYVQRRNGPYILGIITGRTNTPNVWEVLWLDGSITIMKESQLTLAPGTTFPKELKL